MSTQRRVALSFAGEQRPYVTAVSRRLSELGVDHFLADLETVELWGQDLPSYLDHVYRLESRFVIVFISREYVSKVWTRHEFRSALAAALNQPGPFLLPVRFDDSDTPGLPPTLGHLDARAMPPEAVAEATAQKLAQTEGQQLVMAAVDALGYRPFPAQEIDELDALLRQRESMAPSPGHQQEFERQERIRVLVARLRSHPTPRPGDVVCVSVTSLL
ncbi:MAG: TIR domain-containing protein [Candidatus Eisenbacteria bacterium]|uniref:TIR domain-containing protein n=1 Tax=Eiseniibacteriota bacterium TaxID=2212470 RepID=A0A849T2P5_UNCEI|nr:TIR domain-containing protein [Candidatus Eisenbacteria bacterium]